MRKNWSEEDISILLNSYEEFGPQICAEILNRSHQSVSSYAYKHLKIKYSKEDLSGLKFGKLLVIQFDSVNKHSQRSWLCLCECGNIKIISGTSLKRVTKSCGCLAKELIKLRRTSHGNCKNNSTTKEYYTWIGMKNRCNNPKFIGFQNYGERGISVCDRWLNSFDNFLSDMGLAPTKKHSLDRINNNGNYCPENCKWSTAKEQNQNRRKVLCINNFSDQELIEECKRRGLKID